MNEILGATDRFMWRLGGDPVSRATIVTLTLLDRAPPWDSLLECFDRISVISPRFRERITRLAFVSAPQWEPDSDFDIGFHVRRISAPEPRNNGVLLELARRAAMDGFDRAHPLWNVTLVEGLEADAAALLCRFDHSLTDGLGAVEMAAVLFSGPACSGELPHPLDRAAPEGPAALIKSGLRLARTVASAPLRAARTAAEAAVHPRAEVTAVVKTAASMYRAVRPVSSRGSPIMIQRSAARRLHILDVPEDRLRVAGRAAGGSLNDAFLAALVGGLWRYHERHHARLDQLVVSMPISVRTVTDGLAGNRATLARLTVPTAGADPALLIRQLAEQTSRARIEKSVDKVDLLALALDAMPLGYVRSQLRHVDVVASDVPGMKQPATLAGVPVRAQYAFSPTLGAALNATLLSYAGNCAIGLNIDSAAIPDYELMCDCISVGFEQTIALGTGGP